MAEKTEIQEQVEERKPYTTPELVRYGAIEDLTQIKPVGAVDSFEPSVG